MFHRAPTATLAHRETTGSLDSLTHSSPSPTLSQSFRVHAEIASLWRHKGNEHGRTLKNTREAKASAFFYFLQGGGAVNRGLNQPLLET